MKAVLRLLRGNKSHSFDIYFHIQDNPRLIAYPIFKNLGMDPGDIEYMCILQPYNVKEECDIGYSINQSRTLLEARRLLDAIHVEDQPVIDKLTKNIINNIYGQL